jgi:hypothetical protein
MPWDSLRRPRSGARHFNGEREPAVLDALRLYFPGPLNP